MPPEIEDATTDPDDAAGTETTTDTTSEVEQLGEPGKKALDAERARAKALEKELAKFRKAEQARADADKTEAEKRTAAEARADAAELKALKLEVAAEKGLTGKQASRLVGATRDELEADADELLSTFPTTTADKPKPKPDPSQGSKTPPPPARAKSLTEAIATTLAAKQAGG